MRYCRAAEIKTTALVLPGTLRTLTKNPCTFLRRVSLIKVNFKISAWVSPLDFTTIEQFNNRSKATSGDRYWLCSLKQSWRKIDINYSYYNVYQKIKTTPNARVKRKGCLMAVWTKSSG